MISKAITLYKNAYSNHPKEVWDLVILTLINRSGMMVVPFLTIYLTTKLGFSFKEAGLLSGAYGFGFFAGAYFGGKFSKLYGPNIVIFMGLVVSGLLLILMQFCSLLFPIVIVIFFIALFSESFRPAMMVIVGSVVSKNQTGRTIAFIRLSVNFGMAAAPVIGGFIIASIGYVWLFWIDGITCIISAIYFWYAITKWKISRIQKEEEIQSNQKISGLPPYKNFKYLGFLLATFLAAFAYVQWFQTIPVFIKTIWHFDERYIGILFGLNCFLVICIEMPIIDTIEKAQATKISMLTGLVLIGLSFLPFLFFKTLLFCFLAMIFFSMGEILFLPLNNSTALKISPKNDHGSYIAWYWMTWSFALILGPVVGFSVADIFGFSVFLGCLALIALASLFMNYRLVEN